MLTLEEWLQINTLMMEKPNPSAIDGNKWPRLRQKAMKEKLKEQYTRQSWLSAKVNKTDNPPAKPTERGK